MKAQEEDSKTEVKAMSALGAIGAIGWGVFAIAEAVAGHYGLGASAGGVAVLSIAISVFLPTIFEDGSQE